MGTGKGRDVILDSALGVRRLGQCGMGDGGTWSPNQFAKQNPGISSKPQANDGLFMFGQSYHCGVQCAERG